MIALLRRATSTGRLAAVAHAPPLPLLLLEALCRGGGGAHDAEAAKLIEPEVGSMLAAVAQPAAECRRTDAIAKVMKRVSIRIDLARRAASNRALQRKKTVEMNRGMGEKETAAIAIQRVARAVQRERVEAAERKRRGEFEVRRARRASRDVPHMREVPHE